MRSVLVSSSGVGPEPSRSSRRNKPTPTPVHTQRLDIQGLRMVAVMLVVLSHLFHWPQGGFIGVDVFFVISGFLITGSLLHTMEKTGRISFSSFYRRRVRRIVPAATLVLVMTLVAAYFIFTGSRFKSTVWDAVAAFFFVSNWRFGIEGTDYFNSSGPVSALQHYWSLSVEEQFYFVWPAVILAIGVVATRKAWSKQARIAISAGVMGVVVLASFIYSVLDTASNPTWAYFSTLTRVWELGIGALLAITISWFERIPNAARPFIAWTGLALIAVGAFAISETGGGFPAPWAAVPVLGSALVIGAGVAGQHRFLQVLTNRVSTYVGDISYSLYLWHWPVIILLGALMDRGVYYYVGALLLMFGLSIAAYQLFEDPIRRSSWLENAAEKRDRSFLDRSRWRLSIPKMGVKSQTVGIIALTLIVAGASVAALRPITPVVNQYAAAYVPDGESKAPAVELTGRDKDIADALKALTWPDGLTPSVDDMGTAKPPEDSDGCGDTSGAGGQGCSYGSGDKLAVVVGDSIAITWLPGIREALVPNGWQVRGLMKAGCPAGLVDVTKDKVLSTDCQRHHEWVGKQIAELKPDLVIASGTEGQMNYLASGPTGVAAASNWEAGSKAAYDVYRSSGARVVILSPIPTGKDPQTCITRNSGPGNCISTVAPLWHAASSAEKSAAAKSGAEYIDTRRWFCTAEDVCPPFVGTTAVRRDAVHITPDYSRGLKPELAAALRP
ncbi:acyltransferase family protein [Rhodococcus hoagii]|nr:acyltransferase family protein [Prescottella equi]